MCLKKEGAAGLNLIEYEQTMVTPTMAEQLLDLNIKNNRPRRERLVVMIADQMQRGEWVNNGETIKLDESGFLIDGQHRLAAIVRSGKTVPLTIAHGIERDQLFTIDGGAARTTGDHFRFLGKKHYGLLAAASVWYWKYSRRGKDGIPRSGLYSPGKKESEKIINDNPELEEAAEIYVKFKLSGKGNLSPSLLIFGIFLFLKIDYKEAEQFAYRLLKGVEITEGDPIFRLRERLNAMKLQRITYPDYDYLALLIKAWNLYRCGRKSTTKKLYWFESREDFPIPR